MLIEVTVDGETFQHEMSDDIDLGLWLAGYTSDGKYPVSNLTILEWGF